MTNKFAFALALAVAALIAADFLLNGGHASLFLARKFADLTEYIAFWR